MSRQSLKLAPLAMVALLSACSLAPEYRVPETPIPEAYKESGEWQPAQPADTDPRGAWWQIFGDPQLNALEDQLGHDNQALKAAFARLQQARASTRSARAAYYPTLSAGPVVTRSRTSLNAPQSAPGQKVFKTDLALDADLSYEIDAWGRIGNTVSASRSTEQASEADLATLALALHAELAGDYFMLRGLDRQIVLLDQAVADYVKALQLTRDRYAGGVAAALDVDQAQAQLGTARTQAAEARLQRAQVEHAMALITGQPAPSFALPAQPLTAETAPPVVPSGLPSTLLERRPDVAAAERRVAAANAQIGVARAAWFPIFNLSTMVGFESTNGATWIQAPSRFWSLGISALTPVFNGGRISALNDQAKAAYDESAANYRGTVLNAWREVEDALASLRQLDEERQHQATTVAATKKALQHANYRYQNGVTTYLDVVIAENASLQAQLADTTLHTRHLTASVLLIKGLGGGWHAGAGEHDDE